MSGRPGPVSRSLSRSGPTHWHDLLRLRIVESGMSQRQFAQRVILRNYRTVQRWLQGTPIPHEVRDWLEDPWPIPWPPTPCVIADQP